MLDTEQECAPVANKVKGDLGCIRRNVDSRSREHQWMQLLPSTHHLWQGHIMSAGSRSRLSTARETWTFLIKPWNQCARCQVLLVPIDSLKIYTKVQVCHRNLIKIFSIIKVVKTNKKWFSQELERITVHCCLFLFQCLTLCGNVRHCHKSSSTLTLETIPLQRKETIFYKTSPELKSYLESHLKPSTLQITHFCKKSCSLTCIRLFLGFRFCYTPASFQMYPF